MFSVLMLQGLSDTDAVNITRPACVYLLRLGRCDSRRFWLSKYRSAGLLVASDAVQVEPMQPIPAPGDYGRLSSLCDGGGTVAMVPREALGNKGQMASHISLLFELNH
jgi:hypothetical protein